MISTGVATEPSLAPASRTSIVKLASAVAVAEPVTSKYISPAAVEGTPQALKDDLGGDAITVTLSAGVDEAEVRRVADLIGQYSDAGTARTYDEAVRVFTRDAAARLADVVRTLDTEGIRVARLEVSEPTLDDVFLRHTGAKMRVEEVKPRSRMMAMRKRR